MKIAILYGTKYGSAEKVSELISKSIEENYKDKESIDVELINLKEKKDINLDFDVLIIGSSVYMGRIRKEVRKFLKKNKNALIEKNLALFICGCNEDEGINQLYKIFPSEIVSKSMSNAFILGEFQLDKMGFFERKISQSIIKGASKEFKIDNVAIDEFVQKIKL